MSLAEPADEDVWLCKGMGKERRVESTTARMSRPQSGVVKWLSAMGGEAVVKMDRKEASVEMQDVRRAGVG